MENASENRRNPVYSVARLLAASCIGREEEFSQADPIAYEQAASLFQGRNEIGQTIGAIIDERFPRQKPSFGIDAACGTGIITNLIEPHIDPNGRIVGVDILQTALDFAQQSKHPRIEWQKGSFDTLEKVDHEAVDVYTLVAAHGFIEDRQKFYAEIARVLSENGIAIIPRFYPDIKKKDLNEIFEICDTVKLQVEMRRVYLRHWFNRIFARHFLLLTKRKNNG